MTPCDATHPSEAGVRCTSAHGHHGAHQGWLGLTHLVWTSWAVAR